MRVEDQKRAESGIGDGVEGASGEGSDGQGDETNADESVFMSMLSREAVSPECRGGGSRTSRKTSGSYRAKEKCEEWGQGR